MREQLEQVDTTVIDELMEVKRERETVAERLARMGEEQGRVSDVVFRRVRRDYESRASELERKAAPLKDRARQQYARLKSLLDELETRTSSTRLDREEVDFRHRLGEFPEGDYGKRVTELDGRLAELAEELAEIGKVHARFVAAFDSEEDLAAALPPAPEAAPDLPPTPEAAPDLPLAPDAPTPVAAVPDPSAVTAPHPTEPPPAPPAPFEAAPPPPPPNAATILPSEGAPPPPPAPPLAPAEPAATEPGVGRTVVLTRTRLVAVDADLGAAEFPLQPLSFIGRTPDNQVRLNKPAVSRRHAQITQSDKGWTIKDLQSENGSYVNGEKIGERALADGDRVQIGTVRLIFKTG